ncbi:DUF6474 family protein [Corynebacterium alimapuense]|uniref:Uncharacterized protein n=1 Tax=Corynebacterium alimapuense TaxID=1576874 RepID=A0A3M8K9Z5_9CORY|nr:DUF6474 family protein [Corynebacterium alimapuense]RNE50037.1 hypothetical protein C5L39_01315 [Corynebacterium alimapuense]
MGILETIRKSRAKTKAEVQAAKVRARQETKEAAKLEYKREKLLAGAEKDLLKAEKKGLKAKRKHEQKLAENALEQLRKGRVNVSSVSRGFGVVRLSLPLLLPLGYRAITMGREQLIEVRARRLGVSADQLARFSGHGAGLKARIEGIRHTLGENHQPSGFILDAKNRLDQLDIAVDNAEFMTPEQRKRAHSTISEDIDRVAQEIQDHLRRP